MAVAAAPVEYERQVERAQIVQATTPTSRWGAPIWAADEPIAVPERPSPVQIDLMMLALMLSHHSD